jgi:DNA-binding NarL/FixJ family response regulator
MPAKPRIVIADDHTLLLEGLRLMLEPEYELAGVASDGKSLLRIAAEQAPDLILLDVAMPVMNGLDAARHLREISPDSKVIFISMYGDPVYVAEAFRCGACGYLLKRSAAAELMDALRAVLNGGKYVSAMIAKVSLEPQIPSLKPGETAAQTLTPRQQEVLRLVAQGCSRKEIATRLNISVKTVEFHKAALAKGFRLRTTADFTMYAIQHGFIDTKEL